MSEELKEEIIAAFQFLSKQNSKELIIIDRISTNQQNYDRHFTTTSQLKFKLKFFGVRISGGIAMLEGENQYFEFRTDSIIEITRLDNSINLTIRIREDVYRQLEITIKPVIELDD